MEEVLDTALNPRAAEPPVAPPNGQEQQTDKIQDTNEVVETTASGTQG
jgi:hypothetical protein